MSEWKHSSTSKAPPGEQVLIDREGRRALVTAGEPTLLGQWFEFVFDTEAWSEDLGCWWFLPPPAPED